jgi:heme-degrading monooxygenase HmoA
MYLVRDIMYCKPGQARPMVKKFLALSALSKQMGFGSMRVMTDVSAERYWTVVSEMEVSSLAAFTEMATKAGENADFRAAMQGYHDLVESGRREIYTIET